MSKWFRLQTGRLRQAEHTYAFLCLLGWPSCFLTSQILYSDQKPHKTVSCFMLSPIFTVQCSYFSHNNNLGILIPPSKSIPLLLPPASGIFWPVSATICRTQSWHTKHCPCHVIHYNTGEECSWKICNSGLSALIRSLSSFQN